MKRIFLLFGIFFFVIKNYAQTPATSNAAEILLNIKKLNVLGSVLYVAAHPDDENTRLLAYFSKERMYNTGYLSMTRGDGGQNLIGDEQGIELGLIRTQELLAARRIDGAAQFFTRAYDFGFSKSTEEALETWNENKILYDVVWVIRKFKPDVIVTRFPEDSRAGHGQHSASAVLARKAYDAAADSTKFTEQFRLGVKPWKAKRILWNSFPGTVSNMNELLKIDVGVYNTLLGKSYGELAAESRTQHKSQGFGVPRVRGEQFEYFSWVNGATMQYDIIDNVDVSWQRLSETDSKDLLNKIQQNINKIIEQYSFNEPGNSVKDLVQLYELVSNLNDEYWRKQKQKEIIRLIESCAGLWLEASTPEEYAVRGDSLKINFAAINRSNASVRLNKITLNDVDVLPGKILERNKNFQSPYTAIIDSNAKLSQPYWITDKMDKGSYTVTDSLLIGEAEQKIEPAEFHLTIEGSDFVFSKPIYYKHTDPVKGELFQPLITAPPVAVYGSPDLLLFNLANPKAVMSSVTVKAFSNIESQMAKAALIRNNEWINQYDSTFSLIKSQSKKYAFELNDAFSASQIWKANPSSIKKYYSDEFYFRPFVTTSKKFNNYTFGLAERKIQYDHIPTIHYYFQDWIKAIYADVQIDAKNIGYIAGAGDKVPEALKQMGYNVTLLNESDLNIDKLKKFDALVTGVRAYNVHEYLNDAFNTLMQFVNEGGTLVVQYNTSNQIGPVRSKISPYYFDISRQRITDETAKPVFLLPKHPFFNYPNKITEDDFNNWIQERSVYEAGKIDSTFKSLISFSDPNEKPSSGSLIVADYGNGRFVYTALAFFRQLPAGVPGAYRLFANILAKRKK